MGKARSARDIDAALQHKGFLRETDGDHFRYFYRPTPSDKKVWAKTKISHGMMGRTVDVSLIAKMARQLRLTMKQFLQFVDCTMTEEEYREILKDKGVLT